MNVKRLSITDIDAVEQLVLQTCWQGTGRRGDVGSDMCTLDHLLYSLGRSSDHIKPGSLCVFGSFDDSGRLLAVLAQKLSSEFPMHYLTAMVSCHRDSDLRNDSQQALMLCLEEAIRLAEGMEFFKWYYVFEATDLAEQEKYWMDNSPLFQKYLSFTEGIFRKGETSKYHWQNGLLDPINFRAKSNQTIKFCVLGAEHLDKFYESKLQSIPVEMGQELVAQPSAKSEDVTQLINSKVVVTETDLDFFLQFKDLLAEGKIIVDLSGYPAYIANGEHRYFKAEIDGKLVGLSAMTWHQSSSGDKNRIYHRTAYVFPGYRRQGIWKEMMKYKIKYIVNNDWPTYGTLHTVSVAFDDNRYARDNWKVFKYGTQLYHDQTGEKIHVGRKLWFLPWEEIKKKYLN